MKAFIDALREAPEFQDIEKAAREKSPVHIYGLLPTAIPLLVETLAENVNLRLVVTFDERRGRELVDGLKLYDRSVYYYPAKDALFYSADVAGGEAVRERLSVVKRIAGGEKATVVTTVEGLMDKLPKLSEFQGASFSLQEGNEEGRRGA